MARIRTIKPEFYQDEDLATVSEPAFILAAGLLNHADDEGYFKAHPGLIKAAVFPLREPSVNIHGMLTELSNVGYIRLFEGSDGKQYGRITNFTKHQKVNRPSPSKIKPLQRFTENSVNPHGGLTPGKEQGTGKGINTPPPPAGARETDARDRFRMHLDWVPNPQALEGKLTAMGVPALDLSDTEEIQILGEFRSYWSEHPDKVLTDGQWLHKFAQELQRKHTRGTRHETGKGSGGRGSGTSRVLDAAYGQR